MLVGALVIALVACALPAPSPSPAVLATSRFSDPVGDATVDLVAVTTITTAEDVRFEIEFATDFLADRPPDAPGSGLYVLFGLPAAEPGAEPLCNGYVSPLIASVPAIGPAPSGETWTADLRAHFDEVVAPLQATISPRLVTVTVPLALIEDPEVLHFAVLAYGPTDDPPDHSPDASADAACHAAPLTEGAVESPSSR